MEMCQNHWDTLKAEVERLGMGDWIAPDGEVAKAQLVDLLDRGEVTKVNHDPLMSCHNMIFNRAMGMVGLLVLYPDFGCPICRFNEKRTDDGRCPCTDNPECENKAPGSIPNFETWLVGPDSAPVYEREWMVAQGWEVGEVKAP